MLHVHEKIRDLTVDSRGGCEFSGCGLQWAAINQKLNGQSAAHHSSNRDQAHLWVSPASTAPIHGNGISNSKLLIPRQQARL